MTGIEVARAIGDRSHVVFVTAFDRHAIEAFESGAVDYLVKPVAEERLATTVERLKARLGSMLCKLVEKPWVLVQLVCSAVMALRRFDWAARQPDAHGDDPGRDLLPV
jgi:DNA-binding LytR/AlgR family response regulator